MSDLIRSRLNLSSSAEVMTPEELYEVFLIELPLQPDLVLREAGMLYLVEIKTNAVTIDTIARLQLLKDLWNHRYPSNDKVRLVIAAKTIHQREERLAKELDIEIVKLPWSTPNPNHREYTSTKTRITTPKSWKIVSRLLKERGSSIRQLALKEGVSYAWTHRVIQQLAERNIIRKLDNFVQIDDPKPLLNGVAWERPMKNLQVAEILVDAPGAFVAAQEITNALREQKIGFAFTCHTAGALYTGYSVRQDSVYLYLEKGAIEPFREQFGCDTSAGTRVRLYAPDRNVFSDTRERESVQIASPSQTLLDLAGLGYSAMDLTRAMVEVYATL